MNVAFVRREVLLGLLVGSAAVAVARPASALLVRIDLAGADAARVPATFDDLMERIRRAGQTVNWVDGPHYDAAYTTVGGVTYASVSVADGQVSGTVTWLLFDSVAVGAELERSMVSAGTSLYAAYLIEGRCMLQVYSDSGVLADAEQLFARLLGA